MLLAASLLVASLLAGRVAAEPRPLRVLFVGNSLTYYNDLPATFASVYRAANPRSSLHTELLASGGGSLRERMREGRLAKVLEQGGFDVVVLQDVGGWPFCAEGHAACADAPQALRAAALLARGHGARPVWYSTWQTLPAAQRGLSARVREVTAGLKIATADIGAAMQAIDEPTLTAQLLLQDGHPTPAGTWLAAASLFATITGQALPATLPPPSCGISWQGAHLNASALASAQVPGASRCHRLTAAQWRGMRRAVDGQRARSW